MKTILLISNYVMHYRSRIYNTFYDLFLQHGYEFHVISNKFQVVDFPIKYIKHELPYSVSAYAKFIRKFRPDICINFLHLKDKIGIPLTILCRLKHIPMIYWGHGVNLRNQHSRIRNIVFNLIHDISSACIIYSPEQLIHFSKRNLSKTFIAKNTLDFSDVNKETLPSVETIKSRYGIKERHVLLYISRILPYKRLDILLDNFANITDIALVIVGKGLTSEQAQIVNKTPNYYYLGEIYGEEVNNIYHMGDIFSTPGHIGLALNQAMFWGLPVVVLKGHHAPEITYLKDKYNGFLCNTVDNLRESILELCSNENLLSQMSNNARITYENEMSISQMFQGFMDAVQYVENR